MALNALNGSKTEVVGVRVTLLKTVKPTPFSVEPFIFSQKLQKCDILDYNFFPAVI